MKEPSASFIGTTRQTGLTYLKGLAESLFLISRGGVYEADLQKGDLWYFSHGTSARYSRNRQRRKCWQKNFNLEPSLFDSPPKKEKYIFRGLVPDTSKPSTPPKATPSKYGFSHRMLAQEPLTTPAGEVRIADTSNVPVSKTVSAARVIIHPHHLREMHWHPNADEWHCAYDHIPSGDVGIIPRNMAHYLENVDDEVVEMVEIFRAPRLEDFLLDQWLAQTPARMVLVHLNLQDKEEGEKFLRALHLAKVPIK
ncbi:hypothetical protein SpCBS45565_g05133 [Spizellomyces sp. 'palustris']|nr:hypothetical protein SpCBS45565_g05133 [Spizellomyces sp. 'palustris']